MLIATTVVALLCWIFLVLPAWVSGVLLLIVALLSMPAMLAALIYGHGKVRAFAIGTMPPMSIVFLWFTGAGRSLFGSIGFGPNSEWQAKILFVVATIVFVASGFVSQAVRWWCLRSD